MSSSQVEKIKSFRKDLKRKRLEISSFLDDAFYSHCRSILKSAMSMDIEYLFFDNPAKLSGYGEVIRRPVYWKLIEKKLTSYMYSSPSYFIADMRLLFDNCFEYNGLESSISVAARGIEINVEDLFVKMLGEEPPSCDDINRLGTSLENSTARELWKIICFYENRDGKISDCKVKINPKNYCCACQRRMLEILQRADRNRRNCGSSTRQPCSSARSLSPLSTSNANTVKTVSSGSVMSSMEPLLSISGRVDSIVPTLSRATKETQKAIEERFSLDAVPQNTRCDFAVGVVSPVEPCDHEDALSEVEDEVAFADS